MSCAALLAAYGLAISDIDRRKVYEIPKAIVETMTLPQQLAARACAARHGIRWKVAS